MTDLHLALDVRDAAYIAAGDAYVVATTPTARILSVFDYAKARAARSAAYDAADVTFYTAARSK